MDPIPAARLSARLIFIIVGGLLAAAVVGWIIYTLFVAPGVAREREVAAKAETGGAKVQAETAKDAVASGERIQIVRERIERTTRENTIRITSAAGAGDPLPPAVAVELNRALGLRDAYQREDATAERVPDPAAAIGAQSDAGRPAAR